MVWANIAHVEKPNVDTSSADDHSETDDKYNSMDK